MQAAEGGVSIPKFLAGFYYGLTEESHLAEIELCYSDGRMLLSEWHFAMAEHK